MTPAIAQAVARMPPDAREAYEERVAIRVWDAGMSEADAEAAALEDVRREWKRKRALEVRA